MARRNNRLAISLGPAWTDVFQSADAGGADGAGMREVLLSCAADSDNALEYRFLAPADPGSDVGTLAPGEVFRAVGLRQQINHIQMRGLIGAATGGIEEIAL